jgi:hypothetical protein
LICAWYASQYPEKRSVLKLLFCVRDYVIH